MSEDEESMDEVIEELGDMPDDETVASRADGRPPEEESSDDPKAQAQTILEDSEERISEGAKDSGPTTE
jgi:vacuolar-type H+-ATPase subunit H